MGALITVTVISTRLLSSSILSYLKEKKKKKKKPKPKLKPKKNKKKGKEKERKKNGKSSSHSNFFFFKSIARKLFVVSISVPC